MHPTLDGTVAGAPGAGTSLRGPVRSTPGRNAIAASTVASRLTRMTELTVLHTDIPQRAEIDALMRVRTPSCVSLYLPTDPRSTGEAERLDLKSLSREAITQLRHPDADTDDVAGVEAQIADVENDDMPEHVRYSTSGTPPG
jgi:hypothetical protein